MTASSVHLSDPRNVGRRVAEEADALDNAMYDAVERTPTPTLDVAVTWLASASNHSLLSIMSAGTLAATRGARGRQVAIRGVAAIGATSFVANVIVKPIFARRRPDRAEEVATRETRMPTSSSFPSGHTASAFAFAVAVTPEFPRVALPLYALAAAVGYSRVHTGVHYPGDVIGGAVLGLAVGTAVHAATSRARVMTPRSTYRKIVQEVIDRLSLGGSHE